MWLALKSPLTPQRRIATILTATRGFGGRCASANSPRQLKEVIQCLLQTLVRSQLWVYWSARFVDNELAPAARPQTVRAGFRHARDRGPNGRTLRCSCHAVTLSAWIHARAGDGGVRKGSAIFLPQRTGACSTCRSGRQAVSILICRSKSCPSSNTPVSAS